MTVPVLLSLPKVAEVGCRRGSFKLPRPASLSNKKPSRKFSSFLSTINNSNNTLLARSLHHPLWSTGMLHRVLWIEVFWVGWQYITDVRKDSCWFFQVSPCYFPPHNLPSMIITCLQTRKTARLTMTDQISSSTVWEKTLHYLYFSQHLWELALTLSAQILQSAWLAISHSMNHSWRFASSSSNLWRRPVHEAFFVQERKRLLEIYLPE